METQEFNLIDERWILVMRPDCTVPEVSIADLLLHAQDYKDLGGELQTQNFALLRLLLAILHAIIERFDKNGVEAPLIECDDRGEALRRWKAFWDLGHFPEKLIRDYLEKWHERFWLFHSERPFYQSPNAVCGTKYPAAKLNGAVSESNNKARLFLDVSGAKKRRLSYAEAARWLVYINAYDDTSAKPKGKNLPSPGAGWLGKLGPIYAVGGNLFETLMLNLVLLRDGDRSWEEPPQPVWEREQPRGDERVEIALPDNPAQLLTLQSRRLLLKREGDAVTGFYLLGGEFFPRSGAFSEQFTVWRTTRESKNKPVEYLPNRHDPSRQLWREFGAVFQGKEDGHQPGVVMWYQRIAEFMKWPATTMAKFKIVSVGYADKDFFISDQFSDSITFHASLIGQMGEAWQERVTQEVDCCTRLADAAGTLSVDLAKAAGGSTAPEAARAQMYSRLDLPFRRWLQSVDPASQQEEAHNKLLEWQKEAQQIASQLGKEMVKDAGESAFVGRERKEKINGKETPIYYSAPKAYNTFRWKIKTTYGEG